MNRYFLLIVGTLIFNISCLSQVVRILDKTSLQPVNNVIVICENANFTTNRKGEVNLDKLTKSANISFQKVGYNEQNLSYQQIENQNFIVYLSEKSYDVNEIVVSASKFEERKKDVAQNIEIIGSKKIDFLSQPTTADLLEKTGNVFVQKSQLGGGSPVIRGFEANKVLIVVDEVRMNNAIYRGGHLQNVITLDNNSLDKVEIVFGPGSVVYGSDALGGVMHFYTKKPQINYLDNTKTLVKTNIFSLYGSASNQFTEHADINIGFKKFASFTSITYNKFGDLRQGNNNRNSFYGDWGKRTWYVERENNVDKKIDNSDYNIQKQSGYSQYDIMQKFLFKPNDKQDHILNIQYSNSSNINRYDRLTEMSGANPKYAEWYYGPQKRLLAAYNFNWTANNKIFDKSQITLAYQNIEESRNDRKFNNNNINHRTEKVVVLSANIDFAKLLNKNEIRYGIEANYNKVNSKAEKENILNGATSPLDTRYPDGGSTMNTFAAYLTHSYEISEKWILNDGIRYTNTNLMAKFKDKTFFPFPFDEAKQQNSAINGNIGIIYLPNESWRLSILGSSGFRAANVDDMTKVFESSNEQIFIPNTNLKPEYVYNAEFNIQKTFDKSITLAANTYYSWYQDILTAGKGTFNGQDSIMYNGSKCAVFTTVNKNKAYIYGGFFSINADITSNFSIFSSVNYTAGKIKTDTTDYPLDHIPPVFGKTEFILKLKKLQSSFYLIYNGAKFSRDYNLLGEDNHQYSADATNGYMPAWYTLNIKSAYQVNKYLQLSLAIENILDNNYRVFASGISAAGRNIVFSARANF